MMVLMKNRSKPETGLTVENVAVRHKAVDDIILRECIPADGIRQAGYNGIHASAQPKAVLCWSFSTETHPTHPSKCA